MRHGVSKLPARSGTVQLYIRLSEAGDGFLGRYGRRIHRRCWNSQRRCANITWPTDENAGW